MDVVPVPDPTRPVKNLPDPTRTRGYGSGRVYPQQARVTARLKKLSLNPDDLYSFCPISNLPSPSKIIQHVVLKQFIHHTDQNRLLPVSQLNDDFTPPSHPTSARAGPFGSGMPNDNTERLHLLCGNRGFTGVGSWFQRLNIYCWTWGSRDSHTKKEINHILVRRGDKCQVIQCSEVPNAQPTLIEEIVSTKTQLKSVFFVCLCKRHI